MKEEDYVMKLMATYSALRPIEEGMTQQSVSSHNGERRPFTFMYTEPFFNQFQFHHHVDNHNNLRHSPISLEKSISKKDWRVRVLSFVFALVEVNAQLAHAFFSRIIKIMRKFRRKLAK
jgi:hypothetical protein